MNAHHRLWSRPRCRPRCHFAGTVVLAAAVGLAGCGSSASSSTSKPPTAPAKPAAPAAPVNTQAIMDFGQDFAECQLPAADPNNPGSPPQSHTPTMFDTAALPSSLTTDAVYEFSNNQDYFYFMPSAALAQKDATALNADPKLHPEAQATVYDKLILILMPSGIHAIPVPTNPNAQVEDTSLDKGLSSGIQDCLVTAGQQMTKDDGVSPVQAGFSTPADSGVPQLTPVETKAVRSADDATTYCNDVGLHSLNTEHPLLFPSVAAAARAADALLPILASKPDATVVLPAGAETVRLVAIGDASVLRQASDRGCPTLGYLAKLKAALASSPY